MENEETELKFEIESSRKSTEPFNIKEFVNANPNTRVLMIGKTGSGKTYFATHVLSTYNKYRKQHVLYIDPKNEFTRKKELNIATDFLNPNGWIRRISELQYSTPEGVKRECLQWSNIAEYAAYLVFEMARRHIQPLVPTILYYEEIATYVGKMDILPRSMPKTMQCLQQGRALGISMFYSTQMVRQLNLSFLSQAEHVFVFGLLGGELRDLEKRLGIKRNSLEFSIPRMSERQKGNKGDLFSFYHLEPFQDEALYYPPIGSK